jgi:signal transduction histidine kinase
VYIASDLYAESEKAINEGMRYAKLINDNRLIYECLYQSYKMESKRKNYSVALSNLRQIYSKDSIVFQHNESVKIDLLQEQHKQLEQQRENELTIAEQKYTKTLFWASSIVASLALCVILLLIRNVKKSGQTNKQLTSLNLEVSAQKENLNKINADLENIIDERTKDLKIKNNKLSEYSSHLSHQVRSPISSLKGLVMLEKDKLIDHEEFIMQVEKCIEDIDTKIININEMLNDPSRFTLKSRQE